MKPVAGLLSLILLNSCANGKEKKYTGSTPAAPMVRTFLGISLTDSVDFIRWNLTLSENQYTLHCNYGIGKPNTNGFYNGGKIIDLAGEMRKEKNIFQFKYSNRTLKMVELNSNLLHLLAADNSLMIGNGGFSYALNNMAPSATDQTSILAKQTVLKDSIAFEGRTPCAVPGIIAPGKQCYKLKWYIVLYSNVEKKSPATYRLLGTPYRVEGGRRGNWKIITGKDNRIIYQLNDEKKNPLIYLLKLDEGVLIFTDANGNLLVGDHDFSYTLNRRF